MLKFIRNNLYLIILTVISLISSTSCLAAPQDTVKILFLNGNPKIMKIGTDKWIDCKIGMTIDNGDRVKTSDGESIEISFLRDNSNIIKVDEDSDVVVKKKESPYSIELLNGEVMSLINKLPKKSTFEVRTPAGLSGARGTGWRSRTDGDRATFDSFERSVYAKGIDRAGRDMEEELIVQRGWRTTINKYEKPSQLERLSREDFERWNRWKDELREHMGIREAAVRTLDKISSKESRLERMEKEGIIERRDIDRIRERSESSGSVSDGSGSRGGDNEISK